MKTERAGFTLIELMVVVLIMGILASMSVPYYLKTVETSKATDSVALGHLLGNANRMYNLDNPGLPISGRVTNTCNSGSCSSTDRTACRLVRCSYVAQQDWSGSDYYYYVCNGSSGGGYCATGAVASTKRAPGASGAYANWGYRFMSDGRCITLGGAPACPKF